ncbi:oxidoreductase NAD-binding domain-containing protein 1-like isoform X2 [Bradysia coprophila]|uniref:oxidoreductase NAD-binding domain-containing protein 1-like isoform X2 n=1 Tax=Bradysia coprophila TaxID=38358 RepID=UPI00187D7AC2|nr:oxidoreductase NAD-binding domain-containing protein 1-like isoform X2 [Bradysia coprophila]
MTDIGKESPKYDHIQRTGNQQREPEIISMQIVSVSNVSPTVKHLILLTTENPVPISFKAGQWVDMMIPGVDTVGGYSICSSPAHLRETGEFSLCVKNSDHPPAHWVHNECKPGCTVSIRIGGGVGINPLFSIITQLNEHQKSVGNHIAKYCLMYSAKTEDELLFKDSLDQIASQDQTFSVQYFLTDNEVEVKKCHQEDVKLGRITKADIESCLTNNLNVNVGSEEANKQTIVYLCGPPPMIEQVREIFSALGIEKVFYEKWW